MRIENNISLNPKISAKSDPNSNINYYNIKSEPDTVSFGANLDKPARNFFGKLLELLSSPINAIKKRIKKSEIKAQIKKEAEEAAKKAERAAIEAKIAAENVQKAEQCKKAGNELLKDWQIRSKGLFEERRLVDNTGDIVMRPAQEFSIPNCKPVEPPKRGEYTLANFGVHEGYASNPAGQQTWLIRGADGTVVTPLASVYSFSDQNYFADHTWRILHTYTRNNITKNYHKCTVLSTGFPHVIEQSLGRHPGVNFVIEGHIPLKDMQEIKKNIVEKGLWENYIKNEDINAHLGIYNEIINYLNK